MFLHRCATEFAAPSCAAFSLVSKVNIDPVCAADAVLHFVNMNAKFKPSSTRFGASTGEEIDKILEERNAANTNRSTKTAMSCLYEYIAVKGLPKLEHTPDLDLPELLESFYANARTKKGEIYHTQTMKSMRSNLNRWFKEKRAINIIDDVQFTRANLIFKGMKVQAKKAGKGYRRSTPTIAPDDMRLHSISMLTS